ncbi:MAG: UDP-N-acetylglucosamine 2-epimerase (non-hydrolyzing) [Candidatus Paceibacter sp.]|jgi:UDP-N-acetylglucosamine 2-epimerase (non-hydrolysing)|nr:UDP-N-acetylglucosamine 2-epimerase (non-hydrolyzing) [Candidatus Paceibacter sp.]
MANSKRHYAVILGARPNFVKAAPFFREARNHDDLAFTLIHTGQHFDDSMSKIFFDEMQIPRPDIQLDIKGEFHTEKIGKMFSALRNIFADTKFDGVIVFGDINSTLAGAVAGAKHTKLIHIESGLRSHDRRMPEEINRAIVDHLSDVLFTTEPAGNKNLIQEGISEDKIKYVGNIMIESIETFSEHIDRSTILEDLKLSPKKYIVATIHRVENTDVPETLEKLLKLLQNLAKTNTIVFPLHPGTKKKIESFGFNHLLDGLMVIEPLGYFEFLKLVSESKGIVTDSGGIQEETSHLGIACCTLRDNTERPITIELGSNKLFPIESINPYDVNGILDHLHRTDFNNRHIPLWDKDVSKRIFKHLKEL